MAGLPLFICDILAFCLKSRDNKGKAEVMTVLTFQAELDIFGDYMSKELEEEVLPADEDMFAAHGTEKIADVWRGSFAGHRKKRLTWWCVNA